MQEIFNFLKENWQLIAAVITLIVSVVVAIIRKKPVSDIAAEIAIFACYGIIDAERSGVPGEVKKARCIEYVKNRLLNSYPKLDVDKYTHEIDVVIETILTTPQKKGE